MMKLYIPIVIGALSRRRFFCALAASVVAAGAPLPVGMYALADRYGEAQRPTLTFSLDDFAERILEPAMEVMAEFLETHPAYTVEDLVWNQWPDRPMDKLLSEVAA